MNYFNCLVELKKRGYKDTIIEEQLKYVEILFIYSSNNWRFKCVRGIPFWDTNYTNYKLVNKKIYIVNIFLLQSYPKMGYLVQEITSSIRK